MKKPSVLIAIFIIIALSSSCLKHRFSFTVTEDGSVEYKYRASGDSTDLYDGLTILPDKDKWYVSEIVEVDTASGKPDTMFSYIAAKNFTDGTSLPANFADDNPELAGIALAHPSSLKRQNLFFMVNYIFEMTFLSREKTKLFGSPDDYIPEECKLLEDGGSVSDSLRSILENIRDEGYREWAVDLFINRYLHSIEYAGKNNPKLSAFSEKITTFEDSVRVYLYLSLGKYFETDDVNFNDIWGEISPGGYDIMSGILGIDQDSEIFQEIEKRAKHLNTQLAATSDLDDDNFIIEVNLPGKVRSTNADSLSGSTLIWEFGGSDIADSTIFLSAVSTIYHFDYIYVGGAVVIIALILILRGVFSQKKKKTIV